MMSMAHTTVGSIMRSSQAYALQVSRAEALEWGVAYASETFPALPQANQLREVMMADERQMAVAFEAVNAYYASRGLRCWRWVPAVDQPYEAIGQFLWERGWRRRDLTAFGLAHWPASSTPADIRILPARAMRALFGSTFTDPGLNLPDEYRRQWQAAALERLDEASYDGYVAMRGGEAVGRCALFSVGDIGRVIDLYVLSCFRQQGVGSALLAHVLAVAKRLLMRTICLEAEAGNEAATRCLRKAGFVSDGGSVEFLHPEARAPHPFQSPDKSGSGPETGRLGSVGDGSP